MIKKFSSRLSSMSFRRLFWWKDSTMESSQRAKNQAVLNSSFAPLSLETEISMTLFIESPEPQDLAIESDTNEVTILYTGGILTPTIPPSRLHSLFLSDSSIQGPSYKKPTLEGDMDNLPHHRRAHSLRKPEAFQCRLWTRVQLSHSV